ncbi:hypothetical protein [Legionella rowbothamii]|uniref:hypothetical protein n=1 Tax=Legionella rowbothamii TaxID=96229 RepID=UPI001056B545|nr:hypothetical protein [Legionella rowbothamii]
MVLKNVRDEFTPAATAHVTSNALFSHNVSRGTLNGSGKTWIKKEMPDPAVARIEVLAQEFFRLIIPHQGETRLLQDKSTGVHYILSEEVQGYRDLPLGEAHNFANGHYTGLGQALVGAMFLQEIDLKNGNIGLDAQGRVAKIDGDWCFAQGRYGDEDSYNITPEAIAQLPYPKDFYAFNWLDLISQGTALSASNIVAPSLSSSPQFRAEVNQALLMITLLPNSFIEHFVDAYIPAGGERYVDLIKSRRGQLLASALQNTSFMDYLHSEAALEDYNSLIAHMDSFQANGEGRVIPEHARESNSREVAERFAIIQYQGKSAKEHEQILENILSHKVNDHDVLLNTYVADMRKELVKYSSNPQKLAEIKEQLNQVLVSVSSAEVSAVKNAASNLRESSHWYTRGVVAKAARIEAALCTIPLLERGTVISKDGPANKVQEALASHRHWGKGGEVYKTGDKIDMAHSAQTFKDLKAQFTEAREPTMDEDSPIQNPRVK